MLPLPMSFPEAAAARESTVVPSKVMFDGIALTGRSWGGTGCGRLRREDEVGLWPQSSYMQGEEEEEGRPGCVLGNRWASRRRLMMMYRITCVSIGMYRWDSWGIS